MPDLTPAAQAVRLDFTQIMQELSRCCRVSVSFTDTFPITLETNEASLQAVIDTLCAAALRAAVEHCAGLPDGRDCTLLLRSIATELENQ